MENELEAAQEQENNFVIDGDDQTSEQVEEQPQTTESAPVEEESQQTEPVEPNQPTDNFQARINKVTKAKFDEKRRADDLQKQLDAYKNAPKQEAKMPTLEDHGYDEEAFNQATINYQVQQGIQADRDKQQQETQQASDVAMQNAFDSRVLKLGKDDFIEKMQSVPMLPNGVADALVGLDNGPELIYHLGTHLDAADALANMTPAAAMMELGRISANMSVKKEVKTSAAPDPIKTLKSGSSISKERGPVGATYV